MGVLTHSPHLSWQRNHFCLLMSIPGREGTTTASAAHVYSLGHRGHWVAGALNLAEGPTEPCCIGL